MRAPQRDSGKTRVRIPSAPLFASVVSTEARALCTAEVRVQFLPEALFSYARSSVDRALLRDGSGRWFDSSRACDRRT